MRFRRIVIDLFHIPQDVSRSLCNPISPEWSIRLLDQSWPGQETIDPRGEALSDVLRRALVLRWENSCNIERHADGNIFFQILRRGAACSRSTSNCLFTAMKERVPVYLCPTCRSKGLFHVECLGLSTTTVDYVYTYCCLCSDTIRDAKAFSSFSQSEFVPQQTTNYTQIAFFAFGKWSPGLLFNRCRCLGYSQWLAKCWRAWQKVFVFDSGSKASSMFEGML